jgi:flagellar biosynthesis/type III secretory pathway protein FliH
VRNYPATYSLFTEEEKNASDANSYTTGFTDGNTSGYAQGVEDGNGSGINYFLNNPGTYGLYTEVEKNASDANSYTNGFTDGNTSGYAQGVSDGNTSGIQLVVNSPLSYQLFTLAEKEVSDAQAHELGYSDGDAAGYALGLVDGNQSGVQWLQENSEQFGFYTKEQQTSTQETSQTEGVTNAQDELSSNGLSSLTYLEYVRQVSTLYLSGWHHKEGMGWLWTDKQTFPFVFRKESESQPEGWLYFSPLPEQASAPFYDYLRKEWVGISSAF